MKKHVWFILILSLTNTRISAQLIADFEEYKLKRGEYINDASPNDGFTNGGIMLPNFYDPDFQFWTGFSISADTNTTTPGFLNQYSAITGEGAHATSTYAVGYIYDPTFIHLLPQVIGKPMIGMYVTNSTYSYLSMRDGDAFAKKFGGETGADPDWFLLTIKKYFGGVMADDSIDVYLADYRSPDPSKDYIVSDWRYIDLSVLGGVDSLVLMLRSSDVGAFGMNTPAYVCFDRISTDNLLAASAADQDVSGVIIQPNPVSETLYLELQHKKQVTIYDLNGLSVYTSTLDQGNHRVSVATWSKGIYFITVEGQVAKRFVVE